MENQIIDDKYGIIRLIFIFAQLFNQTDIHFAQLISLVNFFTVSLFIII